MEEKKVSYLSILVMLSLSGCGGGGGSDGSGNPAPPVSMLLSSPANPRVVTVAHDRVSIQWDDATGENGYRVMRAVATGDFSQVSGNLAADRTDYTDTAIATDTTYRYRVVAFNTAGDSSSSGVFSVTTPPAPATRPAAPSGLQAAAVAHDRVTLQWSDVDGETGYRVMRAAATGDFSQVGGNLAADRTGYADTTVAADTTYRYRVVAFNTVGDSFLSRVSQVTTPAVPGGRPAAPSGLRATTVAHDRVTLQWNDVDGETGYRVMRRHEFDSTLLQVGPDLAADRTTFTDTTVAPNNRYVYIIVAFNTAGKSRYISGVSRFVAVPGNPAVPYVRLNFIGHGRIPWFLDEGDTATIQAILSKPAAAPVTVTLSISGTAEPEDLMLDKTVLVIPNSSTRAETTLTSFVDEDDLMEFVEISMDVSGPAQKDTGGNIYFMIIDDEYTPFSDDFPEDVFAISTDSLDVSHGETSTFTVTANLASSWEQFVLRLRIDSSYRLTGIDIPEIQVTPDSEAHVVFGPKENKTVTYTVSGTRSFEIELIAWRLATRSAHSLGKVRVTVTGTPLPAKNRPPAFSVADQAARVGQKFLYAFGEAVDPDGDTVSYGTDLGALPAGIAFDADTRTFSGVPQDEGSLDIEVTATDDGSPPTSASATFTLDVRAALPATGPQVLNPLADVQATVRESERIVPLADVFGHPAGNALDYSAESDDASVVEAQVSGDVLALAFGNAGAAVVTVTASDANDAATTASDSFTVTVTDNVSVAELPAVTRRVPTLAEFEATRSFRTREFEQSAGLLQIGAHYAYVQTDPDGNRLDGSGVTVGIVDTGLDPDIPELSGKVHANSVLSDDISGIDVHGTLVASVAAAKRDGKEGRNMHGVAPGADILFHHATESVFDPPSPFDEKFSAAIRFMNGKVDVVNVSLGSIISLEDFYTHFPGLEADLARSILPTTIPALAQRDIHEADRTIWVFAAGNEYGNCKIPTWDGPCPEEERTDADSPAWNAAMPVLVPELRQDQMVAVVAVDPDTGGIADFSNRCGLAARWCLAAPGVDILAAKPDEDDKIVAFDTLNSASISWHETEPDDGYLRASGTSFSAPMVTGAFALLKQQFRNQLGNTEIMRRILATANDEGVYANEAIFGQGLLDLYTATRPVGTSRMLTSGTLDGPSARLGESRVQPGRAYGNAVRRAFAERKLALFDELDAPFWTSLDVLASPAPVTQSAAERMARLAGGAPADLMRPLRGGARGFVSVSSVDNERPEVSRASLHWPIGGKGLLFAAFRAPETLPFGLLHEGALSRLPLADADAFRHPFVGLAGDGLSAGGAAWELARGRLLVSGFGSDGGTRWGGAGAGSISGALVEYRLHARDGMDLLFQTGALGERLGALGLQARGGGGEIRHAGTFWGGIGFETKFGRGWHAMGEAHLGAVRPETVGLGVVREVSPMFASAFSFGLLRHFERHPDDYLNLTLSQPLRIERGTARLSWAEGRTRYGELLENRARADLSPSGRELELNLGWHRHLTPRADIDLGLGMVHDPGHDAAHGTRYYFIGNFQLAF